MGWTKQIFWSIAIVATVLTAIFLVMTLFDTERDTSGSSKPSNHLWSWLDARIILSFLTVFGWLCVITSYFGWSLLQIVGGSFLMAFVLSAAPKVFTNFLRKPSLSITGDVQAALESTGQVLMPIPPHQNGFGKVQLDFRQAHYELDAITTGQEIPQGIPVRIVDVIDNRILVVEALEEETPPDGGVNK